MNLKRGKKLTCIDSRCFLNEYDAGKYLLKVASEHRRVNITRHEIGDD